MIFRSIIFKLLLLIILAFTLTAASILFFAEKQVTAILDKSQQEVYTDKIEVILGILERTNKRLESTGLVDAYSANFRKSAVNLLQETYYQDPEQIIFPTILDGRGKVVMDLHLAANSAYVQPITENTAGKIQKGERTYRTFTSDSRWFISGTFSPWQWTVIYSLPLEVKYRETKQLNRILTTILLCISLLVLTLLSFLFTRLFRPVVELTKATEEIARGNFRQPVIPAGNDEFGTLARSFESMRQAVTGQLKELADKEENLRVTLDSIGDGVIATDMDGRITRINGVACRLTGVAVNDALGKAVEEVLKLNYGNRRKDLENPVRAVLKTGEPSALPEDTVLLDTSGKKYRIASRATPIRSARNESIGVVMVFRDITEEKVMQEQIQHSRRMDAIGQLAGGVAHDFNNMLAGITGASELLEITVGKDEKALRYVDMIKNATERASGLTEKLLSFSRKGKQLTTAVDLHAVIRDTVAILERSIDKRIVIRTKLQAEQAQVSGDPSQLQSGILNICVNARDAMPDGGEISISTINTEFDEEYCRIDKNLSPGKHIQLSIQDSGVGISPELHSRIFEPFFTTKEVGKGTGLGLAAVYGMVKEHHGDIRLYSEPGEGTVFHLFLPTSAEDGVRGTHKSEPATHGTGTILLIDDEDIIRATASLLLENLGYTVLLAQNGEEGVELYRRKSAEVDLVILDMVMPVMDGREAFAEIRSINPEAKVIISSGYARNINMTNMAGQGLAGFITKPFNQLELSKAVADVLA